MSNTIPDLNHGDAMDTTINDGGPAYPVSDAMGHDIGLTKRDWFAGVALQGLIVIKTPPRIITRDAYELADMMLKARDA